MVTGHSDVSHFAAALENTNAATIFQGLDAGALALAGDCVKQHHVGNVNRRLFLHDAAGHVLGRVGAGMAFDHVYIFDQHAIVRQHAQYRAALALVFPGIDDHLIALANLFHCLASYNTSGASEIIFMNCSLRSSPVTGPKMRVPITSRLLSSNTAALASKRITEPSGRRTPLRVRTMTASYTSPFFTLPRGIASFTLTLMTSPILAYRRLEPPSTLMHCTVLAPLLSATVNRVCIWIIVLHSTRLPHRCAGKPVIVSVSLAVLKG